MGTDNYPRVMMGLLIVALLGASLIIVMLLTLLLSAQQPSPLSTPVQAAATATLVPRLLDESPPQSAPQRVILVESQMSKTITAQKIIAITTPVVLEPVYGE